jgi:hypothetical protein
MSATSFFGSFLDGFTGAGLARKLAIPGDPIPGFAPSQESLSQVFLDQFRGQDWHFRLGKKKIKVKVLEAWIDAYSGNLMFTVRSESGKVREVHLERDAMSPDLASAFQGPAR